ncbi:hypothetical protein NDU88_002989 [Pleurodeles waltl]|uniref:Uncharacterized protein n=1 Tax=Pleurodeles waltl TaxID=8319 RepID=A0AAV7LHC1_PLEWA|nr:hypothetical protein NDU88_002989 [Pleurodeles waltl]
MPSAAVLETADTCYWLQPIKKIFDFTKKTLCFCSLKQEGLEVLGCVPWHHWVLKNPVLHLAPNVGRFQRYQSKPEVREELRVKILEGGRHFIDPCMSTWSESLCCEVPRFPTATKDCCPDYRPVLDP